MSRRPASALARSATERRAGHNTALAEEFLAQMIQLLATTEQHRDAIADAMAAQSKSAGAGKLG